MKVIVTFSGGKDSLEVTATSCMSYYGLCEYDPRLPF